MPHDTILSAIFLIFAGAAVLATVALYTRQSLLVVYILLGALIGPWGLRWITDTTVITQTGDIGIICLLFLLGLHLQPQNLVHMIRKVTIVALVSSLVFFASGVIIARVFGYSNVESLVVGAAMMFSSTIIGLKLLPTTILHHQHTGEVMISVLLMQDIIAIIVLLILNGASTSGLSWQEVMTIMLAFPGLAMVGYLVQRFVLLPLLARFDQIQEYIFLVSLGWCLSMAELASLVGLSHEVGAFIAGVSLATNPIALYIAESLKPLRDFFLVLFFFSIGASFNMQYAVAPHVIYPAICLAAVMLIVKPGVFQFLLTTAAGESKQVAWEVGMRLGQGSEFSILLAYLAVGSVSTATQSGLFETPEVSYLIQAATIISFVISSYIIVWRYPTPIATSDKLRRD